MSAKVQFMPCCRHIKHTYAVSTSLGISTEVVLHSKLDQKAWFSRTDWAPEAPQVGAKGQPRRLRNDSLQLCWPGRPEATLELADTETKT